MPTAETAPPEVKASSSLAGAASADDAEETLAHRVELEAFEGPMDLLLHLVRRHEIDLFDLPMAKLVAQYLGHVRALKVLDVDRAGAFLVMAATLVEIKSRTLVPAAERRAGDDARDDAELTEAAAADPRLELVQQLLAYRRFKEAAGALEARREAWESRHPAAAARGAAEEDGDDPDAPPPLDLAEVNAMDLAAAFTRAMEAIGHVGDHTVGAEADDTPISLHADDIADRIARDGGERRTLTLGQVIEGRSRGEAIGLFLALLELVRQRRLTVTLAEADADGTATELALREPDPLDDAPADPVGEPDAPDPDDLDAFDWPEPAARQRHARRLRLRAQRAEEGLLEEAEEPDAAP